MAEVGYKKEEFSDIRILSILLLIMRVIRRISVGLEVFLVLMGALLVVFGTEGFPKDYLIILIVNFIMIFAYIKLEKWMKGILLKSVWRVKEKETDMPHLQEKSKGTGKYCDIRKEEKGANFLGGGEVVILKTDNGEVETSVRTNTYSVEQEDEASKGTYEKVEYEVTDKRLRREVGKEIIKYKVYV